MVKISQHHEVGPEKTQEQASDLGRKALEGLSKIVEQGVVRREKIIEADKSERVAVLDQSWKREQELSKRINAPQGDNPYMAV